MTLRSMKSPDPTPAVTSRWGAQLQALPRAHPVQPSEQNSSDSNDSNGGLHMHQLGSDLRAGTHTGDTLSSGRVPELNVTAASITTDPRAASNDALSLSGSAAAHHGDQEQEEVESQGGRGGDAMPNSGRGVDRTIVNNANRLSSSPPHSFADAQEESDAPASSTTPTPRPSQPLNACSAHALTATPSPTATAPLTVRTASSPTATNPLGAPQPPAVSHLPAKHAAANGTAPSRRRPDRPPPSDALSMVSPARAALRSTAADSPALSTELAPPPQAEAKAVTSPAQAAVTLALSAEPVDTTNNSIGGESGAILGASQGTVSLLPPRSPKPRLDLVQHKRSPDTTGSTFSVSSGTPLSGRQFAPLSDVRKLQPIISSRSHSPPRSTPTAAADTARATLSADTPNPTAPGITRASHSGRSTQPAVIAGSDPLLLREPTSDTEVRPEKGGSKLLRLTASTSVGVLERKPMRAALKQDSMNNTDVNHKTARRRSTGYVGVRFVPSIGKLQDQDCETLDKLATRALGVRLGDRAMLERWQEARAELEQERERVHMLRCMAAGGGDGKGGGGAARQGLKLSPRTIMMLEDELIQKEHQEQLQHRERSQQRRRARSLAVNRSCSAPPSTRRVSWVDDPDAAHPGHKQGDTSPPCNQNRQQSQPDIGHTGYSLKPEADQPSVGVGVGVGNIGDRTVKLESAPGRQQRGPDASKPGCQGGNASDQIQPFVPKLNLTAGSTEGGERRQAASHGDVGSQRGASQSQPGGGSTTRRFGMSPRMQIDTLEFPIVDLCEPNEIVYLRRLGRYVVDTTGDALKEHMGTRDSLKTLRGLNALHRRMSAFIPRATRTRPAEVCSDRTTESNEHATHSDDDDIEAGTTHRKRSRRGRALRMSTFEADDVEAGSTPWCGCGRSIVHLSPAEITMPQQFLLIWAVVFYYAELVLAAILIGAFLDYGETLATVVTCLCVFAFPTYRAVRWLWLPIYFSRTAKAALRSEREVHLAKLEQAQTLLAGQGGSSPIATESPEDLSRVRLASAKSTSRLVAASTQRALLSICLLEVLVVAYKLWREAAWDRLVMYIVPAPLPVQLSESERRAAVGERVTHRITREQASIHLNAAGDFNCMHERLRERDALLQQLKANRLSDAAYRRRLSRFKTYASLATMRYQLLYSQTFPLMCIVLYSMLFHQFNRAASTYDEFTDDEHENALFWVALGFTLLSGGFSQVTWRLQYRYRNPLTADLLERSETESTCPFPARFEPLHQSQMILGGGTRHSLKAAQVAASSGGITLAQRDTINTSRGGTSDRPRRSVPRFAGPCCCSTKVIGKSSVAPRALDEEELRIKPFDPAQSGIAGANRAAALRVEVVQPEDGGTAQPSEGPPQQAADTDLPETPARAAPASVRSAHSSRRVHSARSLRLVGHAFANAGDFFSQTKTSSTVMPLMAQGFTSGLGADIHAPVSPKHTQSFFALMSCCELVMRATTGVALSLAFGFWALCFAALAFVGNFLIIAWAGHLYPAKPGSCMRRPQLSGMTIDFWTFVLAAKNAWLGFVAPQELPVSPSEFLHASGALNLKRRMSMNRMSSSPTLHTIAAAASQVVTTRHRRFCALWAWQLGLSILLLLMPLLIPSELLGSPDSHTLMSFVCPPNDPTCPNSFPFWFAVTGVIAWMGTCSTALYFLRTLTATVRSAPTSALPCPAAHLASSRSRCVIPTLSFDFYCTLCVPFLTCVLYHSATSQPEEGCGLHKILVRVQPLVAEDAFIIQQYIRMHPGSVFARDRFGNTALHVGVMTDFTDTQGVVQWLMYAYPEAASMPNMVRCDWLVASTRL